MDEELDPQIKLKLLEVSRAAEPDYPDVKKGIGDLEALCSDFGGFKRSPGQCAPAGHPYKTGLPMDFA